MSALFLAAALSVLPTPEYCIQFREGYIWALCHEFPGEIGALCYMNPRPIPSCPSEGGTLREGWDRGAAEGEKVNQARRGRMR